MFRKKKILINRKNYMVNRWMGVIRYSDAKKNLNILID